MIKNLTSKTSNPIKITSLSLKTECLFTFEWLNLTLLLQLLQLRNKFSLLFTTATKTRLVAVLLRACWSYRSSGDSIVAVPLPRFIKPLKITDVWGGGYNFGLCCLVVLGCPKGGDFFKSAYSLLNPFPFRGSPLTSKIVWR